MKRLFAILLSLTALNSTPAHAVLNVLACEPEWAALTQELAGDKAKVASATSAMQDPHHIEARPALIAQARRADLLVCTGAELEIGWLPLLQRESGNANIQSGQPGYFEAASAVQLLDKSAVLDRAMGDVHAAGNPHLHLNPHNVVKVAEVLTKRFADIDPTNAAYYTARHKAFAARMQAAIVRWEKEGASLRGTPIVVHHKNHLYLADWLGLKIVADLEPKPGIDPSVTYLGQLLDKLKAEPARMVLRAVYQSPKPSEWIAERAAVKAVELPYTVGGSDKAKDLFSLFDDTLAQLTGAIR